MHFRYYSDSYWQDVDIKCPRCDHDIVREVWNDGMLTNHFACRRLGCTWPDHGMNIEKLLKMIKK